MCKRIFLTVAVLAAIGLTANTALARHGHRYQGGGYHRGGSHGGGYHAGFRAPHGGYHGRYGHGFHHRPPVHHYRGPVTYFRGPSYYHGGYGGCGYGQPRSGVSFYFGF